MQPRYSELTIRQEVIKALVEIGMTIPSGRQYHFQENKVFYCYPEFDATDPRMVRTVFIDNQEFLVFPDVSTKLTFTSITALKEFILNEWKKYISWI